MYLKHFLFCLTTFISQQAIGQHFEFSKHKFLISPSQQVFSLPTFSSKPFYYIQDKNIIRMKIPGFKHAAFFCKMEDKLYKRSGKNVKFNLGLNSYVNYLEGKSKYY